MARSAAPVHRTVPALHSVTHWRAHARRHPLRHRLALVAPDAADAVRHAGGWLFDRASNGWEVTACVTDARAADALRILGATVLDAAQALAAPVHDPWPMAVGVSVRSYRADERVRRGLLDCLDRGLVEVVVWGDDLPPELAERLAPSRHRVSVAARAFKSRALTAAGLPAETIGSEVFGAGTLLPPAYRPEMRDLLPA